jgi:hypothetical protein
MDIWLMSLVLALEIGSGHAAQRVFKCVDAGRTAYQYTPCMGEPAASWEIAGVRTDPEVERKLEQLRVELRSQRRLEGTTSQSSGRPRGRGPKAAAPNPCERARSGREAAYIKAGLKRSFQLSSRWDNAVHDACR